MENKINHAVFSLLFGISFNTTAAMPDDFSVYSEATEVHTIPITILAQHAAIHGLGSRVGLGGEYDIGWNVKLVAQTYASFYLTE